MLTSLRCDARTRFWQTLQITICPRQKALPHAWGRAGIGRPTRQQERAQAWPLYSRGYRRTRAYPRFGPAIAQAGPTDKVTGVADHSAGIGSTAIRQPQKISSPSSIPRVKKGATGSTMAPARASALPAFAIAWRTAGCGLRPTPVSSMRPRVLALHIASQRSNPVDLLIGQCCVVARIGLTEHSHRKRRIGNVARQRLAQQRGRDRADRVVATAQPGPKPFAADRPGFSAMSSHSTTCPACPAGSPMPSAVLQPAAALRSASSTSTRAF